MLCGLANCRQPLYVARVLGVQEQSTYIDGTAAAKYLGVTLATVKTLIERGIVPGFVFKDSRLARSRVLVPRESLAEARNVLQTALTTRDARAHLRVTRKLFEALVDSEVIQLPPGSHSERGLVLREQVDTFVSRLESLFSLGQPPKYGWCLRVASQRLGRTAFVRLIRAVFDGKVQVWRAPEDPECNTRAPLHVLISISDFEQWRNGDVIANSRGLLTVPQAALLLHEKEEVFYHLVRNKLIPSTSERVAFRTEALVSPANAVRFFQEHLSASALNLPTIPKYVVRHLRACGITPITGPDIDGGRQYFFKKTPEVYNAAARFVPSRRRSTSASR